MGFTRRSSASKVAKVLGGFVLGILIAFVRAALTFVAIPAGLVMWLVLLPTILIPLPKTWRAARQSPLYCVKFALVLRDALLGRTLARPLSGDGANPWPWPWNESPSEIRKYRMLELIQQVRASLRVFTQSRAHRLVEAASQRRDQAPYRVEFRAPLSAADGSGQSR